MIEGKTDINMTLAGLIILNEVKRKLSAREKPTSPFHAILAKTSPMKACFLGSEEPIKPKEEGHQWRYNCVSFQSTN